MAGEFDFGGAVGDFGGGFDFGGAVGNLTDLPIGGLPLSGIPTMDFGMPSFNPGMPFFPGEGGGSGLTGAEVFGGGSGDTTPKPSNFLDTLGGIGKGVLPFVQAAVPALGAYTSIQALQRAGQQQKVLDTAEKTSAAAAAPGVAAAGALIPAGTSALLGGPLPPELEAQVNTFKNNEKLKARALLVKMGITDSTMAAQVDSYVEQQAMELRAKLSAGLLQSGTGAIPQGVIGQAGSLAAGQVSDITKAMQDAQRSLGLLLGQQA